MTTTTRDKVTGALFWTVVPRGIQMIVGLVTSSLIVRGLSEFDYGTFKMLSVVLQILVIVVSLGLGNALNRFVPEIKVTDDPAQGRALLLRCVVLQSALWGVVSVAAVFLRPWLLQHFPTFADILVLGVFLAILEILSGTFNQYALASYKSREMALAVALGTLIGGAGMAFLLKLGMRIPGVLVVIALGHFVNVVVILGLLARSSSAEAGSRQRSRFPWSRLLRYAVPWAPNHVLNYLNWRASESFILGLYWPREIVGYFDRAYTLPQMMLEFIPNSVYSVVLAGFSETASIARDRMAEFISLYYRLLFFVVAPVSLLGFAMGDLLLVAIYTEKMAPGAVYCQWFFLVFTVSFFGTPLSMAVYVVEKVWVNLVISLAYATLTVGLDFLLIPKYGMLGAAIPTAFVTALTPFVRWYIARRYVPNVRIPWGFILRAYAASSPLLGLLIGKRGADNAFEVLGLCVLAGLLVLVNYRVFGVLGPEERALIARSRVPAKDLILKLL